MRGEGGSRLANLISTVVEILERPNINLDTYICLTDHCLAAVHQHRKALISSCHGQHCSISVSGADLESPNAGEGSSRGFAERRQ